MAGHHQTGVPKELGPKINPLGAVVVTCNGKGWDLDVSYQAIEHVAEEADGIVWWYGAVVEVSRNDDDVGLGIAG